MKITEQDVNRIRLLAEALRQTNKEVVRIFHGNQLRPDLRAKAVELDAKSKTLDLSLLRAESEEVVVDAMYLIGEILEFNGAIIQLLRVTRIKPEVLEKVVELDQLSVKVADAICPARIAAMGTGEDPIQASAFFKGFTALDGFMDHLQEISDLTIKMNPDRFKDD